MKTKFLIAFLFIVLAITYCAKAATIVVKISQFPNTTTPGGTDLFLLASGSTNKNISWNQLKDAIGTNPATVTILNNLYVSNVFSTNIYSSNIYATNITVNEFHGKTSFITNLFLTQEITNYFLFSTNIYQSYPTYVNNSYVSNYFQTNVFQNTYMSNYFNTNQYLYLTNIYFFSTNLTVTNFYGGDTYVSNFFNTNVFVVDNTVSNFFATNIYNTINISSNYTYQYSQIQTNPVFYGTGLVLPWTDGDGNPQPSTWQVVGNSGYSIYLDGETGDVGISGTFFGSVFSQYEDDFLGPTNTVDTFTANQYYATYTPISITGFINLPTPGYTWAGLITITNASTSNVLWTLPSGLRIPERTNQVAISNASQGMLSIGYSHRSGTNGIFRQFLAN